jgi:hypothetical protein
MDGDLLSLNVSIAIVATIASIATFSIVTLATGGDWRTGLRAGLLVLKLGFIAMIVVTSISLGNYKALIGGAIGGLLSVLTTTGDALKKWDALLTGFISGALGSFVSPEFALGPVLKLLAISFGSAFFGQLDNALDSDPNSHFSFAVLVVAVLLTLVLRIFLEALLYVARSDQIERLVTDFGEKCEGAMGYLISGIEGIVGPAAQAIVGLFQKETGKPFEAKPLPNIPGLK